MEAQETKKPSRFDLYLFYEKEPLTDYTINLKHVSDNPELKDKDVAIKLLKCMIDIPYRGVRPGIIQLVGYFDDDTWDDTEFVQTGYTRIETDKQVGVCLYSVDVAAKEAILSEKEIINNILNNVKSFNILINKLNKLK